jgi:hypothetical protein
MASFQQSFAAAVETLKHLAKEAHEVEKRALIAPFQQRRSELEKELESVTRNCEGVCKELEQRYKAKTDEGIRFLSSLLVRVAI